MPDPVAGRPGQAFVSRFIPIRQIRKINIRILGVFLSMIGMKLVAWNTFLQVPFPMKFTVLNPSP